MVDKKLIIKLIWNLDKYWNTLFLSSPESVIFKTENETFGKILAN